MTAGACAPSDCSDSPLSCLFLFLCWSLFVRVVSLPSLGYLVPCVSFSLSPRLFGVRRLPLVPSPSWSFMSCRVGYLASAVVAFLGLFCALLLLPSPLCSSRLSSFVSFEFAPS